MFIDTLYFHYVVIWKKTDLSRFFFTKWELQLVQKKYIEIDNFFQIWNFSVANNLNSSNSVFKYIYILFNYVSTTYTIGHKKNWQLNNLWKPQCKFRREVQCMNQLLRNLNDYTWLQKITCKERQNQIFLCSILYLVEQNI